MRRRPLESLGALVRAKRGGLTLRKAAATIGIGPATLLRVESGRVPDVSTFGKLCHWLEKDPREFLGSPGKTAQGPKAAPQVAGIEISAHLRADRTPEPDTIQALANMLVLASRMQPSPEGPTPDDEA